LPKASSYRNSPSGEFPGSTREFVEGELIQETRHTHRELAEGKFVQELTAGEFPRDKRHTRMGRVPSLPDGEGVALNGTVRMRNWRRLLLLTTCWTAALQGGRYQESWRSEPPPFLS